MLFYLQNTLFIGIVKSNIKLFAYFFKYYSVEVGQTRQSRFSKGLPYVLGGPSKTETFCFSESVFEARNKLHLSGNDFLLGPLKKRELL